MKTACVLALTVSLANSLAAPATEGEHEVSPELLNKLHHWLDEHTEFEKRDSQPNIVLIDLELAEKLRGSDNSSGGPIGGLYDSETETIYLTRPWSPSNQRDISVLLHEMVHHRQSGRHWYCPQAQEWRAYQIQAQWLQEQNIDSGFYWPAILLKSSCAKRDVHPD